MQQLYIDNRDGFGFRDFTKFLEDANQFFEHTKNEPQLFDFNVVQVSGIPDWVVPRRGAFVRFLDDRWQRKYAQLDDNVLYTGYVTEEPDLVFLGKADGAEKWGYNVKTTSEEFLANSKRLPAGVYVNKTRGYILVDLLRRMFSESEAFPFDASGVRDGGTERLYQVDTNQTWAEIAATFARADGYSYWILDNFIFYGPEAFPTMSGDPLLNITIDSTDPRYTPSNLDISRVSRDILNDVTVFGEDEPADIVEENFVSDGYQGFHDLAFAPFGVTEDVIVEDDLTADLDTEVWEERDTGSDYLQVFDGALNIIGGPGTDTGTVFIRARRPIELAGVISIRDGEIYFPPTPTGVGYIGGLYTDDQVHLASLWCGWKLDCTNRTIVPYAPTGLLTASTYSFIPTRHYVLRRTIQVNKQVAASQTYYAQSSGQTIYYDPPPTPVGRIIWEIQEINQDDPNNVLINNTVVADVSTDTVPDFVLYALTAPDSCHYVTNFVSVTKPQQAVLTVNGRPTKLGKFLDGGRAALQDDNNKGKLAWYSTPQASDAQLTSYEMAVMGDGAVLYLRMGESSGTTRIDRSGAGHTGTASASVTAGISGALYGDDDTANRFNGSSGYITGAPFLYTVDGEGSIEVWFKTTTTGTNLQVFFSSRDYSGLGELLGLQNGQINVGNDIGGYTTSIRTGLNDGRWHHVVATFDGPGSVWLYIDGELDRTVSMFRHPVGHDWYLGRDLYQELIAAPAWFEGDLDEFAFYDVQLTASQVKDHYKKSQTGNYEVVTVPPAGSSIKLQYYRKRSARARVKSIESIKSERERFRDDGIRQKVIRAGDTNPTPRTSQECLALAQAAVIDASSTRIEGTYKFTTVTGTPTELRLWPKPGDKVRCEVVTNSETIIEDLVIESVNSVFLGKEAYEISISFGPTNRFDLTLRDLILKRKSSLEDPAIADADTETVEALQTAYPYPDDLIDCQVSNITATQFTVNVAEAGIPGDVVNYEVRTDDTGWGRANYVVRFNALTHTFTRTKRDILYYIRPYNAAGQYSKRSAIVRVACPTTNGIAMTGVTGDVSSGRVRVIVPIPRDPDYGGIILRHHNASGDILYQGNGATNVVLSSNVSVLASAGTLTIDIPNLGYTDNGSSASFEAYVNTYNLLNLFGTAQVVMISNAAEGAWSNKTFDALDFTASAGNWTLTSPDQATFGWTKLEDTMTVSLDLITTSVSATPASLRIKIPGGYKASMPSAIVCVLIDNNVRATGIMSVAANDTYITIQRFDLGNFGTSTNLTAVKGSFTFPVIAA